MSNTSFLTLGMAAKHYPASKATIQRAIKNGDIAAEKVGNEWRINPAELDRWQASRVSRNTNENRPETPSNETSNTPDTALKDLEIQHLKEKIAMLEGANDDLRSERDEWKGQAKQVLLTYQHDEKKAPAESKGFFGIFKKS